MVRKRYDTSAIERTKQQIAGGWEDYSGYHQASLKVIQLCDAMLIMQDSDTDKLYVMLWAMLITDSENKEVYELAMQILRYGKK